MSTESSSLEGNVDDVLVKFLRSGFMIDGRRGVIDFRVRLGQSGLQASMKRVAFTEYTMTLRWFRVVTLRLFTARLAVLDFLRVSGR